MTWSRSSSGAMHLMKSRMRQRPGAMWKWLQAGWADWPTLLVWTGVDSKANGGQLETQPSTFMVIVGVPVKDLRR